MHTKVGVRPLILFLLTYFFFFSFIYVFVFLFLFFPFSFFHFLFSFFLFPFLFLFLLLFLFLFLGGIVKIKTLVEFTTELSTLCIRDTNGEQINYRLTGMIRHRGYSIAAGHFIAYVLIDGGWYEANDESMGLVSWPTVRSLEAYLLFYERQ